MFNGRTIRKLAEAIRESVKDTHRRCLIPLKPGNGVKPLVLVHPIGGALLCYRELIARLRGETPIYGFQAAGLHSGENLPASIEDMAQLYLGETATTFGQTRMHLAGWSFGGVVAFEMARQLTAKGFPPLSLTLIDAAAPLSNPADGGDNNAVLRAIAGTLSINLAEIAQEGLSVDTLISMARGKNGDPPLLSKEQIARMINLIHNARRLRFAYRPESIALTSAVTVIRAAGESRINSTDLGWRDLIEGAITVMCLEATHYSIIEAPQVDHIAEVLNTTLDDR
jgi:thioesterase domain-containing protein